ncbi:beta-ketoacyl synthase, partial [Nonomuraea longispora]
MSGHRLAVTGWGVLSGAGEGIESLVEHVGADRTGSSAGGPRDVGKMFGEPLPTDRAHALPDFDVRSHLGRKGTSNYDRTTALAVVASGEALREAGESASPDRVGVVVGTTLGSFRAAGEFSRETLIRDRPHHVAPGRIPSSVMNGAAGQTAIRYGLHGVNATIAGGAIGFFGALRYAATVLRRGYVDTIVAGAVEELSPHRMWQGALSRARRTPTIG